MPGESLELEQVWPEFEREFAGLAAKLAGHSNADDVLQETHIEAYRAETAGRYRDLYGREGRFAFLLRILRRRAARYRAQALRQGEHELPEQLAARELETTLAGQESLLFDGAENRVAVANLIACARLDPIQRECLADRALGLDTRETSARLALSPDRVRDKVLSGIRVLVGVVDMGQGWRAALHARGGPSCPPSSPAPVVGDTGSERDEVDDAWTEDAPRTRRPGRGGATGRNGSCRSGPNV